MTKYSKAITLVSREILYRFIYFFLCFILCSVSSWIYEKELLFLYLYPLLELNQNIMYTSISDAFYTSVSLCIWVSLSCCLPTGLYHILCFFLPSFFPLEKKKVINVAFFVTLLYIFSYILCNIYVIPELCGWFLKFGVSTQGLYLSLQACVSNYVSWSIKMYIICLCVLEIPIVFWILLQIGLWKPQSSLFLSRNRKYASLGILLLCAAISPPDVYSQGTLFLFFTIIIETVLWYSFLNENINFQRTTFCQITRKTVKKS